MKVKNIFSNRKSKKKKNAQQTTSADDVTAINSDKLIIPSDGNISGKENERLGGSNVTNTGVVLRSKVKRGSLKNNDQNELELTKARASSTSSNNSTKAKSSRRPWSFIDQLRRQDSRESAYSTSSSASTSLFVEDSASFINTQDQETLLQNDSSSFSKGRRTLPRSLTPEQFEQGSKADSHDQHSHKRRTMDFRFFNFFKRSTSGETSMQPEVLPPNSGRSSFRGKNRGKKKGSSKKKSKSEAKWDQNSRRRSLSDGGETSHNTIMYDDETQIPPPGLYDSTCRLNSVDEYLEPVAKNDKRVPVNGEPAFYLDGVTGSKHKSLENIPNKNSRKYMRRSDPVAGAHGILRSQTSDTSGLNLVLSTSDSIDSSSRRSSFVCEPIDSSLPEDSIASFDSSAYLGARIKRLNSSGSVPQISLKLHGQAVHRALSSEIPSETQKLSVQARYSQSVSNLAIGNNQMTTVIPRSSSDTDKTKPPRRLPKPSPHQQKQEEYNALRLSGESTSADFISPPSPVLRAIGYPGVVLRRNKHKKNKQRPNSAYADERTQHVLSLNMEDLPTYSRMRHEMTKGGANFFPSFEDILAVRETATSSKIGSSGVQYAGTASSRARRRGATMSNYGQRSSAGLSVAASAEDLDSLSSSNYGSKQSLSDLSRMDEDERLNAFLARSLAVTHTSSGNLRSQEPSSKRAKAIRKSVVSLANLISPGKPNQKSSKLQRSSSFKESGSVVPSSSSTATVASFKPYRPPSNTPNKAKNNRRSKLWCESFDFTGLNEKEIKWQEAIFELFQGERDLVLDLTMAKQTYRDSMVTLKMLSEDEVTLIFGKLGCLLPLHEELLHKLEQARGGDGRTLAIAYIFVEWFPRISKAYREYCANQSDAKYALDAAVERDARVRDFLQRCLESPFSRKLDLWSYLDLPRTRLVKYPLLLQNVLKRTPVNMTEERSKLDNVMAIITEIIERVDETTGEQQCSYIRSKLEYLDDKQRSPYIDNSRLMLCSGQLKNNRGTKMHVFLFEEAFVLTRQTTRSNKISYQVYRVPLPLRSMVVDTNEGDKLSGSFRGGILSSEKVKHSFRVRSEELNLTYTLQASEEHDRKQWINAILDALSKYKAKHPEAVETQAQIPRRRATYDPTINGGKKQAARAVLRSSSDKSNRSVASSTEQSLQEESQEEDSSIASGDVGPWTRSRSQTVNPSILSSKSGSSVSRKSSGSSTKSDKSSKDKGSKKDIDTKKLKERLLRLDGDGPPSPLRESFKKKSGISRHFSLSSADKRSKPIVKIRSNSSADAEEKERNKCQRSRSLTSSPMNVKAVGLFGRRRISNLLTVNPASAKPPIGPTSSPYSVRRSPSLRVQASIHEAQSTPNLTVGRSISFSSRRSSSRLSQLAAQNNSNSVGNLRKGLAGSSSDLRSSAIESRAEEAKLLRRARSADKPSSEGDKSVLIVPVLTRTESESTDEHSLMDEIVDDNAVSNVPEFIEPEPVFKPLPHTAVAIICTPATPNETPVANHEAPTVVNTLDETDKVMTITATVIQEPEAVPSADAIGNHGKTDEIMTITTSVENVIDSDIEKPEAGSSPDDDKVIEDVIATNDQTNECIDSSRNSDNSVEHMDCEDVENVEPDNSDVIMDTCDDVITNDGVTVSEDTENAAECCKCEIEGTKLSQDAVRECFDDDIVVSDDVTFVPVDDTELNTVDKATIVPDDSTVVHTVEDVTFVPDDSTLVHTVDDVTIVPDDSTMVHTVDDDTEVHMVEDVTIVPDGGTGAEMIDVTIVPDGDMGAHMIDDVKIVPDDVTIIPDDHIGVHTVDDVTIIADDDTEVHTVDDVTFVSNMAGNMLVRSTEDLLAEYDEETPPVHNAEGDLISFSCFIEGEESKDGTDESKENVCESEVVAEEGREEGLTNEVHEIYDSPIEDDSNKETSDLSQELSDNEDNGEIPPGEVDIVAENKDEEVAESIEKDVSNQVLLLPAESQHEEDSSEILSKEKLPEKNEYICEDENISRIPDEDEIIESSKVDDCENDEGIVQDDSTSEANSSDFDNNNIRQTDSSEDKTQKDNESDEQSCLKHDSETTARCRDDLPDDNINSTRRDIQASV